MTKLLRIRATDRDADLLVLTDEGQTTDLVSMAEAELVIARLADQIRGLHSEAQKDSPGGMAARIKRLERELEQREA